MKSYTMTQALRIFQIQRRHSDRHGYNWSAKSIWDSIRHWDRLWARRAS